MHKSCKPPVGIVRRRVHLDFRLVPSSRWFRGPEVTETFLNAVSFFFPPGEKFFIDSVQKYKNKITDPVLQDQVQRFIYQEAMHTKVHRSCNAEVRLRYPNGHRIEALGEAVLNFARWCTPRCFQLAVTCAIEHFTAMLADKLLQDIDGFRQRSSPAYAELWLWHAVEESEHKAVCFDVYRSVVGTGFWAYLNRVVAMIVTTAFLLACVSFAIYFTRTRGQAQGGGASASGNAVEQKKSRGSFWRLTRNLVSLRLYFDYFRPGFHPWDHDNSSLIDAWKARFPDFGRSPDDQRLSA